MFKKSIYLLALVAGLASCTEDYTDWANPQSNAANEAAEAFVMTVTPGTTTVDFATETADSIQLFSTNLTEGQTSAYTVTFYSAEKEATTTLTAAPNGKVATADLEKAVTDIYGKAPQARSLTTTVRADVTITTADNSVVATKVGSAFTFTGTPNAPVIEEAYYYIGSLGTDMSYQLSNGGGDVYENPVFTVTIPASGQDWHWFKIAPKSGFNEDGTFAWANESSCVCATTKDDEAMEGKFVIGGNKYSWHLLESNYPTAKYYTISVNMLDQTYTITPISFTDYIYYAGDWTSWQSNKKELALTDTEKGIYEGYYYISAVDNASTWGFKFIDADGSWYGDAGNGSFSTSASGNMNPGEGGFYKISVDWANSTYALTAINSVGVVGSAAPNGWDQTAATPLTLNVTEGCWEGDVTLSDGAFKFVANYSWDINWGGSLDNLTNNGSDISVSAGTYHVAFYPNCPGKAYATLTPKFGVIVY